MLVHSVTAENFGSYKTLKFQPSAEGLTLIHGATGSGKSTLPDVISWTLFGITSKDMSADDVKSWSAGDEDTVGIVMVDDITVVRTRGKKNDLYWTDGRDALNRGKDLVETQHQICERLRASGDLYAISSRYWEHSDTASFFTGNARTRREVLEQVTDLTIPMILAINASNEKKTVKAALKTVEAHRLSLSGAHGQTQTNLTRLTHQAQAWEKDRAARLAALQAESEHFEELKDSKIKSLVTKGLQWEDSYQSTLQLIHEKRLRLSDKLSEATKNNAKCEHCGVAKGAELVAKLRGDEKMLTAQYKSHAEQTNPFLAQVAAARKEENRKHEQIEALNAQTNPHAKYLSDVKKHLRGFDKELSAKNAEHATLSDRISILDQVYDLSFALRGQLLQTAVKTVEDRTNQYLETYFDSEFRVAFDATDGDSIDVQITRGGYSCGFRQLSKGQRQLLKLSFSVAIMEAAANSSGTHFEQLFFDEALDGLSDELKMKAFGLFEHLAESHDSVFVIDHSSAFQEMFSNSYVVTITGEHSEINKQRA